MKYYRLVLELSARVVSIENEETLLQVNNSLFHYSYVIQPVMSMATPEVNKGMCTLFSMTAQTKPGFIGKWLIGHLCTEFAQLVEIPHIKRTITSVLEEICSKKKNKKKACRK